MFEVRRHIRDLLVVGGGVGGVLVAAVENYTSAGSVERVTPYACPRSAHRASYFVGRVVYGLEPPWLMVILTYYRW